MREGLTSVAAIIRGRLNLPGWRLVLLVLVAALLAAPLIPSSAAAPRYGTCKRGQSCYWNVNGQDGFDLNVPGCHPDRELIVYTAERQPSGCGSANEIWYMDFFGYTEKTPVFDLYAVIGGRDVCANVKGSRYYYDTPIITWPCNPRHPSTNEEFFWDPDTRFVPVAARRWAWNVAGGLYPEAQVVLWSKCECTNEYWDNGVGNPRVPPFNDGHFSRDVTATPRPRP
jgi:hypothetical protein